MRLPAFAILSCILSASSVAGGALHVPSQYPTIQAAIDASSTWPDIIELAAGTYSGPGFQDITDFRFVGELIAPAGPESTVIDLQGNSFSTGPQYRDQGITFQGGATAIESKAIRAISCHFDHNQVGIRSSHPALVDAWYSKFSHNDTGIAIGDCYEAVLACCHFLYNGVGVSVGSCEALACWYSIFAYNGVAAVVSGLNNFLDGGSVFYHNLAVGDVRFDLWVTCHVVWYDTTGSVGKSLAQSEALGYVIIADPLFCDTTLASGTDVHEDSPCLLQNNVCSLLLGSVAVGCSCCEGERGNVDLVVGPGGPIDVADVTYLVGYLFQAGAAPPCEREANVDGIDGPGGPIDVADLTYLVAYLFQGGPLPPMCHPVS
jgi:hypothetical protein